MAFNVADSPSFGAMIDKCIQFGQQNIGRKYKVPIRRKIGGPLLDSAYEEAASVSSVQPIMERAKKYCGTLASDGWNDVQRRPTTNFMLVTRESSLFMKSISQGRGPRRALPPDYPGVVTRHRALRGAGRGALISPRGAGRGALVSAPQRSCQP